VPAVTQPGVQDSGPTALERTLGALPEAVQQAGGLAVKTEELQAHRQKVFDTLNGKERHQDFRLGLQPAYDQWRQNPDWQTLPERVTEEGGKLIETMGANLSPYARRIFQDDAKQTLAVFQQRAIEERTKRTEGATAFTFARELQQGQTALAQAQTPYEVLLAQGQLEETVKRFVETGLIDGVKAATALKGTYDAVADEQVLTAIEAQPSAMREQLHAQAAKQPTREDLPLSRPEKLAEHAQRAFEVEQQRINQREHAEKMAEVRWGKQQDQNAATIRAELSTILPTQENIARYDALLADVNAKAVGPQPQITGAAQQEFTNHIRILRATASHPRETDDGPTERDLIIKLDAANSERDYAVMRQMVVERSGLLKPETFQRFMNTIRERTVGSHYSQDAAYKEGTRIIYGSDIAEGTFVNIMRSSMAEDEQKRLRNAMDNYRQSFEELWKQDQALARSRASELALDMRYKYMDVPGKKALFDALPRQLQGPDGRSGITNEAEVDAIIQKGPGDKAEKQREKDRWKKWYQSRGEDVKPSPSGGTTPATQPWKPKEVPN
jgi:hypothetical protein